MLFTPCLVDSETFLNFGAVRDDDVGVSRGFRLTNDGRTKWSRRLSVVRTRNAKEGKQKACVVSKSGHIHPLVHEFIVF